jgi:hypothetical protein
MSLREPRLLVIVLKFISPKKKIQGVPELKRYTVWSSSRRNSESEMSYTNGPTRSGDGGKGIYCK